MGDDFQRRSLAFLNEFKAQSDSSFHEDLQITDLRTQNRGRGIIATADIPAESELFTISRHYVISVENSRLFETSPQLFADLPDVDGDIQLIEGQEDSSRAKEAEEEPLLPKPWLDLILVLIHDHLHRETTKWGAYWDVLPKSFDTLMFWSEAELEELQASSVRSRVGKQSADNMFKKHVIPVIKKHETTFYPNHQSSRLDDRQLLALCHRMGSLIMAYAFDLQTSDEDEDNEDSAQDGWAEDTDVPTAMGMVPMADMLNADAEFNAHLEHGDTQLTMRALRTIKKGEEVFNYYGPLGNGDLARRYGYTSRLHSRYDVVEITWQAVMNALTDHFGHAPDMNKVRMDEDDIDDVFVLERETGDPDETGKFTSEAKFTTFPEELIDQVTTFASAAMGLDGDRKPNGEQTRKLKQAFLQIMSRVITSKVAEYSTTADDDELLLSKDDLTERQRMAVVIRLGEKKLLHEATALVNELMKKYQEAEEIDSRPQEPPQKKRRTQQ